MRRGVASYTILPSDVGRIVMQAFGRAWSARRLIGRIAERSDIGRRVYSRRGIVRLETDGQRDARERADGRR